MNPVRAFHYVCVLDNSAGNWYTGCTSDLKARVSQHLAGKSEYTRKTGPYKLIYYEACLNKQDAYQREKYLKSGPGKQFLKKRLKRYLEGALTG